MLLFELDVQKKGINLRAMCRVLTMTYKTHPKIPPEYVLGKALGAAHGTPVPVPPGPPFSWELSPELSWGLHEGVRWGTKIKS